MWIQGLTRGMKSSKFVGAGEMSMKRVTSGSGWGGRATESITWGRARCEVEENWDKQELLGETLTNWNKSFYS